MPTGEYAVGKAWAFFLQKNCLSLFYNYSRAMITATQISDMSRTEKIQAMEILWSDISRDIEEVESPPWHGQLLRETEARYANGQEKSIDWKLAKEQLRKRFE